MRSEPFRLDVNPQLECAETLASRYYTDPAMLSLEKERSMSKSAGFNRPLGVKRAGVTVRSSARLHL